MIPNVRILCADGVECEALVEAKSSDPMPGVLLLHEVFGLTEFIRSRMTFLANRGFIVMAPDLYHRIAPGKIFDYSGESRANAIRTRNSLNDDQVLNDLAIGVEVLRRMPGCNGQVSLLGYCLGGLYAFLGASRLNVCASVGVHGVRIEKHLDEVPLVKAPLQLHFCGRDKFVPADALDCIKAAVTKNHKIEIRYYPDSEHGFTRKGQPVFNHEDAQRSDRHLFDFLSQNARA